MDSQDLRDTSSGSVPASGGAGKRRAAKALKSIADNSTTIDSLLPVVMTSKQSTIYVSVKSPGVPGFSTTSTGTSAPDGVVFSTAASSGDTLVFDWMLETGIRKLRSDVPGVSFTWVTKGSEQQLQVTVPATFAESIPFFVEFTTGEIHDPQIIVTPISGGQQATKARRGKPGRGKKAPARKTPAKRPVAAKRKAPAKRKAGKKR